jgi:hypothetical protein
VPVDQRLTFALNNNNVVRPFGVDNNCGTNPPPCGHWGNINQALWNANSNYHALQTLFRTRVRALDAQFAYTWSKSLSDTDLTNSGNASQAGTLSDPFDPHHDYGPTQINRPHVFVGNIVYNVPTFAGHNAFTRYALGGWELASILSYASGPNLTIYSGTTVTGAPGGFAGLGTGQNSNRPNVVPGTSCYASGGTKNQWLNPEHWTMDGYQLGTLGNDSVGSCSGPGIANTDFSVYKNFKVTERVNLQFRLELYNLFNKAQFRTDQGLFNSSIASGAFACASTNVSNVNFAARCPDGVTNLVSWDRSTEQTSNFGQVNGDRGPREIQYALKITF